MKTKTKNLATKWGIAGYDLQKIYETIRVNKKVKSIILFGSRAKGNYRKGSDIDLAIQADGITIDELLQIKVDVNELMLPYKVDIVEFNKVKNKDLKEHILRVGKYLS